MKITKPKSDYKIVKTQNDFRRLRGNFTEIVRITHTEKEHQHLSGWYIYEQEGEEHRFTKRNPTDNTFDQLRTLEKTLTFDEYKGILPDPRHTTYERLDPGNKEHEIYMDKYEALS